MDSDDYDDCDDDYQDDNNDQDDDDQDDDDQDDDDQDDDDQDDDGQDDDGQDNDVKVDDVNDSNINDDVDDNDNDDDDDRNNDDGQNNDDQNNDDQNNDDDDEDDSMEYEDNDDDSEKYGYFDAVHYAAAGVLAAAAAAKVNADKETWSPLWSRIHELPMISRGSYVMHPRNSTQVYNLSDPVTVHVNAAEAALRRGMRNDTQNEVVIRSLIEFNYIENPKLEEQFIAKKQRLLSLGCNGAEQLMFHGTHPANTHNICTGNFNLAVKSKRFAYGRGIYFSQCPNISLGYGSDLILCRVLPGLSQPKDVNGNNYLKEEYDSLEGWGYDDTFNIIVIKTVEQILPYCIIRVDFQDATRKYPQPSAAAAAAVPAMVAAPAVAPTAAGAAGYWASQECSRS
jgi:Fe2+ transport system protein FeoA